MIVRYLALLLLLFIAHTYFSNLDSPLKLIPQTMAAISMGWVLMLVLSLRHFTYLAEFIDWTQVTQATESEEESERPKDQPT
ncbi:MAG: hypothetical protein AMXMBFR13_38990 [Phycisphaerae bacterium]